MSSKCFYEWGQVPKLEICTTCIVDLKIMRWPAPCRAAECLNKSKLQNSKSLHSMTTLMTCNMETSLRNRAARAFTQPQGCQNFGQPFTSIPRNSFKKSQLKIDSINHTVEACLRTKFIDMACTCLYTCFVFVHTVWDKNIGEDLTTMERKPSSENVVQAPHKGARLFVRSTGHRCPDHAPTSRDLDRSDYAIN